MTPQAHYDEAEQLLCEGAASAARIRELAEARKGWPEGSDGWASLTRQMDAYGKKCMGIWAQAQVHATLSTIPFQPFSRSK